MRRSRPRASWSTSSRPRPRPRSGTSGAWRATSTRRTRRSPRASAKARARSSARTWRWHLQVLAEDLALAFADARGERLVLRVEVARHAPEVPDRGLGLGRDEVDHDARGLDLLIGLVAALARHRHAHFDHHVAG